MDKIIALAKLEIATFKGRLVESLVNNDIRQAARILSCIQGLKTLVHVAKKTKKLISKAGY